MVVETDGEMTVRVGSTVRKEGVRSWTQSCTKRDRLVQAGKLEVREDPDYYVFVEDVPFSSPSAAAAVVAARNTNGRMTWRIPGINQTYADWQEAKIRYVEQTGEVDEPDN
tara:strand:- start:9113 stop:9445 length:333 start_codon:yes stop_codon:yes gene_type:complete